jgi:Spy/CpxP family protein refolding chaperone
MHRGIHRHALAHVRCGRRGFGTHRSFPVHEEHWSHHGTHEYAADPGGGSFGVRRPLRFLAFKLGLSDEQVVALARILDELKTERAQHEVDDRRRLSSLADAASGETFDEAKAREGAALRSKSVERLEESVVKALGQIHAVLDASQRERFSFLIRTGRLSI